MSLIGIMQLSCERREVVGFVRSSPIDADSGAMRQYTMDGHDGSSIAIEERVPKGEIAHHRAWLDPHEGLVLPELKSVVDRALDIWWIRKPHFEIVLALGGIRDPVVTHLMALYALSIVVRYLPLLWHEIEDGKLDHIRALIEHCITIFDNVVPGMAIERITGRRFIAVTPGSLQGPI